MRKFFSHQNSRAKNTISLFLSSLLVVTLLPLVSVLTAKPARAAITNADCVQTVSAGLTYTASAVSGTNDCLVQFTAGSGTWTKPVGVTTVQYLIVAGGGSGGNSDGGSVTTGGNVQVLNGGGGGGGGGLLTGSNFNISAFSTSLSVSVGAGGAKSTEPSSPGLNPTGAPTNGGDSSVFGLVATGGGRGGYFASGVNGTSDGASGGSGGGGRQNGSFGFGTSGQGSSGGAGATGYGGGGGGSIQGGNATGSGQGAGGTSYTSSITGVSKSYSGGGDGGTPNTPGYGGSYTGIYGMGGGGGGGGDWRNTVGYSGASGIVVVRYTVAISANPTISTQPSNTTVTAGNAATFSVSATSASGTLTYQWESSTDGTNWSVISGATSSTYTTGTLAFSDSGKKYRVKVTNTESGKSPSTVISSIATLTVQTTPGQVTGLTAAAGDKQALLSWTAPSSNGGSTVTDYVIEQSLDGSTNWTTVTDEISTATSSTVTELANSQIHYFRVSAKNAIGTGTASTVVNATPISEVDYSLTFDGTDDYLAFSTGQVIADTGDYTMEAWVYDTHASSGTHTILYHGTDAASRSYIATVKGTSTNEIKIALEGSSAIATGIQLPQNQWAHVALTRTGTTYKLYLNGQEVDSGTVTRGVFSNGVFIGSTTGAGDFWKGKLDQVKFYSAGLTDVQVKESMHTWGAASGQTATLLAHLDFNDASISSVLDNTTNSKNFTINGSPTVAAYEDIKKEASVSGKKAFAFPRSYLTDLGGWKAPTGITAVDYLVIGGGAGGGNGYDNGPGGGGGAGGFLEGSLTNPTGALSVQVGPGGLGGAKATGTLPGANGLSSKFATFEAFGGGGGAGSRGDGLAGASGGGASGYFSTSTKAPGSATVTAPSQGFAGGSPAASGATSSGGGGGAGSTGKPGSSTHTNYLYSGGAGGDGKFNTLFSPTARTALGNIGGVISGANVIFASGGKGGALHFQSGVDKSVANGIDASSNTGNGGSGGQAGKGSASGGNGGSGFIFVAYDIPGVPGQVTGLTATLGNRQVSLSWTAPTNTGGRAITDYVIEQSTDNSTWTTIADGTSTSTSYTVTSLTNETTYYFRVSASNAADSIPTTLTTGAASTVASSTPSNADKALATTGTQYASKAGATVIPTSGEFTVETWIKPANNIQAYARFLSQGTTASGHFHLERNNAGQLYWRYGAYADVTGILPLDTWTHVAFTRSNSGIKIFLNGIETYNCAACTIIQSGIGSTFMVGSDASDPLNANHPWKGSIDEVRVYNTAKSQLDIQTDLNTHGPVSNSNLLAYYDFNGISGAANSTILNKATGTAKLSSVDLIVTGTAGTENIATEGTSGSNNTVTFSRSYLTSDGGYPVPDGVTNLKALVVGGGGGGGWGYHGGGGGAGEVIETQSTGRSVTPGDILGVTVGTPGGGTNAAFISGKKGASSSLKFSASEIFTANGGGAGGGGGGPVVGTSGGSGGGGNSGATGGTAVKNTYSGWNTYATAGGTGAGAEGGGGGGAGGAGANTSSADNGGAGGVGIRSAVTGNYYGGGGGGAWGAPGGTGGGGNGGNPGTKGVNGTGGGGGSAAFGGSGVVVLSYSYAPNTPTNLVAAATSPSEINLSWTASTGTPAATDYVVEQSTDGTNWAAIGTTTSATTTYSVTGLSASTIYYFRVAAKAGDSQSGYISTSATTKPNPLPAGAVCDGSSTQNGLTATAGHGKVFYIDTGQGQNIDAGYVAYGIKSTSARSDLWVELSGFTGGVMSLADPSTSALPLGSVTANGTGTSFFMLKASGATLSAQSHVLRVYNSKPSIGNPAPIYECTFAFTRVEETIKAAANKVESIVSTSVSSIGSTMTITVEGDSGTIGQGNDLDGRMFWLIPAARSTWPVNAVRLEKTELSMFSNAARTTQLGSTFVNTLRINDSNGLNAATRQYWRAVYTFRAIGVASSTAPIIPIAMISSGTQIKHTDVASLPTSGSTTLDLTNPTVKLAVNKSASTTSEVRTDGTTRFNYSINLVNSGSDPLIIDEVIDTPDSKLAYVSGTSTFGDGNTQAAITDPGKIGTSNSIAFTGPITVPANSTRVIKYSMAAETCKVGQSYTLQNTATARSGVVVIGSGSATQSVVTVNGNCGSTTTQVIVTDDPIPPTVITDPASSVTQTTATINGSVDPNTVAGRSVRFNFSTSSNLSNPTAYNLSNTTSSATAYGVSKSLTGLTANTTYYYRLEVFVDGVWKLGEILSFTTPAVQTTPIPKTNLVTDIAANGLSAKFNGTLDANFVTGGVKGIYEYKSVAAGVTCSTVTSPTATGFLQDESATPTTDAAVTGSGPAPLSYSVTGLTANTDYCVRIVGVYGAGSRVEGEWVKFTSTAKLPQVIGFSTLPNVLPAGGTTTVTATNTGANSSNPITYTSVDPSICTVASTGAVTAVSTSGTCVITATQNGNDAYYPAEPQTISFAISPPEIITKTLATGTYGSSYSQSINATGGSGTYTSWSLQSGSELPPGLTFNSSTGVILGTPTLAGIYVIYVVTTDSNGITSAPQPITITINKVTMTVTASSHTLAYLSSPPNVAPSFDATAFIGSDNSATLNSSPNVVPLCTTAYTSANVVADSGIPTTCSNGWATNYTFTYVAGTITITPYSVTITADNKTKKSGEADPAFTFTNSALPAGKTLADVITTPSPTLSRTNSGSTTLGGVITPAGTAKPNYIVTFVDGSLTVTAKNVPTITTTNHVITYGTTLSGKLNASASTAGTFAYSYVDENGSTVSLTSLTELSVGNYTIKAVFTPTDGDTYEGPIQSSFTITVDPFELTITAKPKTKVNKISGAKTAVSSDPDLEYTVSPATLPYGEDLDKVFVGGVSIARANSGTPAGTYLSNLLPTGELKTNPHTITPSGTVTKNYKVNFVSSTLTIAEKILPVISATDTEKTAPEKLGNRLNGAATHLTNAVPGVYEYYLEATNQVVTSETALPAGEHKLKVKFTPTDLTTYEGPIFGSFLVKVNPDPNPPATPGPTDPGSNPIAEPTTPAVTPSVSPTTAVASPSPTSTKRGGTKAAPAPKTSPKPTPSSSAKPMPTPTKNGPYVATTPVIPGIGGLINVLPSTPKPSASGSASPAPSGSATAQPGSITVPADTTIDFGRGVQTLTVELATGGVDTSGNGKRTLGELAEEKLVGFHPPGAGVQIEVLGARSGARFVLSDAAQVDAKALMAAMNRSIDTQAADFFAIENLSTTPAPQMPTKWTAEEQAGLNEFFAGAGLANPISLADVNYPEIKNWVGVQATASTYAPGSTVYLTVTSTPLVIAAAVVDKDGNVNIEGSIPVEFLGAGEHRVRLVGTRILDGVYVDNNGEVQVTDATLQEIERFDLSTQATIGLIGKNAQGGVHAAMRVIPLEPTAPWWTITLLAIVGLALIGLRRRGTISTKQQRLIAIGVLVTATLPAVIIGWLSTVTQVVWVGIALSIGLNVATWLTKIKERSASQS